VRENDPYPPDYARDGDVIRDLYADDDGGTTDFAFLEVEPYNRLLKIVARREALKLCEVAGTDAAKECKSLDAELLHFLAILRGGNSWTVGNRSEDHPQEGLHRRSDDLSADQD